MIIYIAGPMTGRPGYNAAEFIKTELFLSDMGHTVLNPARHIPKNRPESIPHEGYMKICLAMVDACEAIYLLNGWAESKGSKIEVLYAIDNKKKILSDEDLL